MAKCAKCNRLLGKKCPGVQCNKCSKWFHGSCASLTTDQLSALAVTDSVDWKCHRCSTAANGKPKRISVILPDPEDEDSDAESTSQKEKEKLLYEIRHEVREMWQTVRDIIRDELQNTLKFYSSKIDEYEDKMQSYETRVKLMENQCKNLSNTCKNLLLKNDVLEQKVNKMEQAQIYNEIEICGIKEAEKEDVKSIALLVGKILNQKPDEIIKTYRKKKNTSRSGPAQTARFTSDAPIVVALRDGCRDSWLRASKGASICAKDLGVEGDYKIYVRASLSPTTAYLLWKAKTDLRDKSLCKFVWCNNGMVMVRKTEGDKKIYYVWSAGDIETIKEELSK